MTLLQTTGRMRHGVAVTALSLLALACATGAGAADRNAVARKAMEKSFVAAGQAGLSRLQQDATQAQCSLAAPGQPAGKVTARIQAQNAAAVKLPADGRYLGDWKRGEAIAQSGTGLQSSDDPAKPAGGNCYACHQMAQAEVAYGTIGPSLAQYGKLRGQSQPIIDYTWRVLYNAKSYFPCTHMPRFGTQAILDEQQLKDVMAYLLDPASPVNQ
ncbi:MAG: hypothetical protein RL026_69 [Pseudomonadota bacterium]